MLEVVLIGAQVMAGPSLPVPEALRATRSCPVGDDGEIVVCGRPDQERYRLRALPPPRTDRGAPRTEATFGRATVGVTAVDATLGGGVVSHRAMLNFRLRF